MVVKAGRKGTLLFAAITVDEAEEDRIPVSALWADCVELTVWPRRNLCTCADQSLRNSSGQSLVETALMLPLLILYDQ